MGLSRRGLVAGGLASIALARVASAATEPATSIISPDVALKRLLDGNARYAANHPKQKDFSAGRAAQAKAQFPIASILGCADARVAPEHAFDEGPGQLFVVRIAGNILEDEGLASLEYGARFLGVPLIFVLGHSDCGAVTAAIKAVKDGATLPGHLPGLIDQIKPAVLAAQQNQPADLLSAAIAQNVRGTMQRITTATPILADMIAAKKVKVSGGVYDIATGKITLV